MRSLPACCTSPTRTATASEPHRSRHEKSAGQLARTVSDVGRSAGLARALPVSSGSPLSTTVGTGGSGWPLSCLGRRTGPADEGMSPFPLAGGVGGDLGLGGRFHHGE